jgi:hypothetical protein
VETIMKKLHEMDPDGANLAAAVKAGFAVVFVGLLVAMGMGLAPSLPPEPPVERAAANVDPPAPYFPSQYELDAREPAEHVQAF